MQQQEEVDNKNNKDSENRYKELKELPYFGISLQSSSRRRLLLRLALSRSPISSPNPNLWCIPFRYSKENNGEPSKKNVEVLMISSTSGPGLLFPKVISNKGCDGAKADLWSCGVILYVLMAGYLPFEESNLMVLYKKRVLAKESKLHLAQKEQHKLKERLQNVETIKSQEAAELERAKRTVEDLSQQLKAVNEAKELSTKATEAAMDQEKKLEESNSGIPTGNDSAWNYDSETTRR